MKYTTNAYLITCLTNLHVGSEGVNYGVVDNLVQRDTITENPVINSSSLKGALREFFKDKWGEKDNKLKYIFGTDSSRDESGKGNEGIGNFKFFEAKLLSMPMRSNKRPYYNVTTSDLINSINRLSDALNPNNILIDNAYTNAKVAKEIVQLEDWNTEANPQLVANPVIGENIAIFDTETFKKVVNRLPVIARNKLDNGESKNLWYEEVVPRETRFVFFISMAENYQKEFNDELDNAVVQIGGNASIGYGFTRITKIPKS
jgi:CRISPR-associated protein Cmr4